MIKDFFIKNKRLITISACGLALAVFVAFYFILKNTNRQGEYEETLPPPKTEEQVFSGDPVSLFIDLLSRQASAKYYAVYDSVLEESSTSTVKQLIFTVKQTDGKRKSDIWFNTAKVISVIQNSDGAFACYWASDYKAPPCYKMSPGGALAESLQKVSGEQPAQLKAMAEKGLLDIKAREKTISIGGEDRSCAEFTYSLKPYNISAADVRALFPIIGDVPDEDIALAFEKLSLIKNNARVCLDIESGVPLETDISLAVGTGTKQSTQRATYFALNPVFNEQLALEPLQRFDGPLFEYVFKKMFPYNNDLYVSANGITRVNDGAIMATSTGYGNVRDFIAHKGAFYAAAGKGAYRLAKDYTWEKMESNKSSFSDGIDMFEEVNGELYAQGEYSGVFRLDQDIWVEAGKFPKFLLTTALYEYNGQLFARTLLDGVFRLDGNVWTPFLTPDDFRGSMNVKLRIYHDKLYAIIGSDIFKIENGKPVQIGTYKDYGSANVFFERPEDGIYVGSDLGLYIVNDATTTLAVSEKAVGEVNAITIFGNSLYIGTDRGVFVKDGEKWRQLSWPNDIGPINAFYVFNKNLYTAGALGLGKLAGNEWVTTAINLEDEKLNSNIEDAVELNGRIYVITKDRDDATLYVVNSIEKEDDEFGLPPGSTIIEVPILK